MSKHSETIQITIKGKPSDIKELFSVINNGVSKDELQQLLKDYVKWS